MKTQSLLIAATLCATVSMASAQNEPSQDTMRAPTGVESTAPNNPPIATAGGRNGLAPCARTTDERTGS